MSTRAIHEINACLASMGPKAATILARSADCAAACDRAGVQLDAVERRFLTSLPAELWVSLRATTVAALEAGRTVTVDWAPGFTHELSVSVPKRSGYNAVTILLRTPSPRRAATARKTPSRRKASPRRRSTRKR